MYVLAGGKNKESVQVDSFTTATPAGVLLAVRSVCDPAVYMQNHHQLECSSWCVYVP